MLLELKINQSLRIIPHIFHILTPSIISVNDHVRVGKALWISRTTDIRLEIGGKTDYESNRNCAPN